MAPPEITHDGYHMQKPSHSCSEGDQGRKPSSSHLQQLARFKKVLPGHQGRSVGAVVLQPQPAVAGYENLEGQGCIRNRDAVPGEKPAVAMPA